MHTSSMWHPILLVFNNEERLSIYTANNDGDNIPPCRTPLSTTHSFKFYRTLTDNYIRNV